MELFQAFISEYGTTVLYALLTGIAGYFGIAAKKLYVRYRNDKDKKEVIETCVKAVEQIYQDLHGEEKLQKAIAGAMEMLAEKGIAVGELELRMRIEAALAEHNSVFERPAA